MAPGQITEVSGFVQFQKRPQARKMTQLFVEQDEVSDQAEFRKSVSRSQVGNKI
jgi:hypothetical protein